MFDIFKGLRASGVTWISELPIVSFYSIGSVLQKIQLWRRRCKVKHTVATLEVVLLDLNDK